MTYYQRKSTPSKIRVGSAIQIKQVGDIIMNEKNTLNILNGQAMYGYFKQHNLDKNGIYVPFNEAMCTGKVTEDIFSSQFKDNL